MRFIELFAGIGGFRFGLESVSSDKFQAQSRRWNENERKKNKRYNSSIAGERRKNTTNFTNTITERIQQGIQQGSKNNPTTIKPFLGAKQFTCVYANEWDKYACQIYRKNFGEGELYEGDIRKVSTESIPDHDFLVAGFPCPSYSIAGKREGFADSRGSVYFEIPRIAKAKRPHLLLLENVKGLLNHDGGNTFRIILYSLSELGYDCEWEVLNSKNFGVPQNRERVFIIGHFRGTGGQKVFPIGETGKTYSKCDGRESKISSTRQDIQSKNRQTKSTSRNTRIDTAPNEDLANCLDANYFKGWRDHGQRKMVGNIRRLTPIECERLQGFPDGYTEGISDTQRYKCLGNAVTVNVVEEIGKKILKVIK